jgi:hypothetical protein
VSACEYLTCKDRSVLRNPHCVLDFLDDTPKFDSCETFRLGDLSDSRGYGDRHATKVVGVGKQRCSWLTNSD